MAVEYVSYGSVRVSKRWAVVLRAADRAKVGFHVTSGHRTLAEQQALYNQNMVAPGVPKAGRPLTAVPNSNAPHIREGRPAHALDVNALDGGETRLQRWLEKQGARPTNPVPGEAWHLEVTEAELERLWRKFKPLSQAEKDRALAKSIDRPYALKIVQEARKAGLPLPLALALVEQESDFRNVFGHDPTIFAGAGTVTEAKYKEYKLRRGPKGAGGMQGVGPVQLTWFQFQDEADRMGGCWKPEINMRVGFRLLSRLIKAHGLRDGVAKYNGSGEAADRYAQSVLARRDKWAARL